MSRVEEKNKIKDKLTTALKMLDDTDESEEIINVLINLTDELNTKYGSFLEPGRRQPNSSRLHLDKYWKLARNFFKEGDFPLAAFFAITLIEEISKFIIVGQKGFQRDSGIKRFYNHKKKYETAILLTLIVNSRVSRIYGEFEKIFAKWFRDGDLFRMRNKALYMELHDGKLITPDRSISREDAFLLVCFGGEIFREIQGPYTGWGMDNLDRITNEIDIFRNKYNAWPNMDNKKNSLVS